VLHAVEPIVAAHPGGRIACVAHGGVLDCIYRFAMRVALQEPRKWPLLNCSINIVDFETGAASVVAWGDIAHLSTDTSDDGLRKTA
jgi:probable phosphoglycerate mutase